MVGGMEGGMLGGSSLTLHELSVTAAREMDRAKEGKVCKALSSGAEEWKSRAAEDRD